MSATGRSNVRRAADFYETPAFCTRAIIPHLIGHGEQLTVLDPCAGNGAILDEVRALRPSALTVAIELDFRRALICLYKHAGACEDALDPRAWPMADVIIANPPFSLAMEFVQRALKEARGGTVAMLLRLAFVASQKRAAWWRANMADIYVLPRRPSFTGKGTDSSDYGWFVWGPGRGGRWHVLEVER